MKKLLVLFLLTMGVCVGNAEEMQFITTLSSPVGTFAQLEAVHPLVYAEAPIVNFCNTRVGAGRMTVNGANAYVSNLVLQPSTTMGGNVPEYRIATSVLMYGGGSIKGGRLMANEVGFWSASQPKSDVTNTLYTNDVMLQGAKTTNLTIPGKVQTINQGSGEELEWSNIYNKDYVCDDNGNCQESGGSYTSYLLKSVGGSVEITDPTYKFKPEIKTVQAAKKCGGISYIVRNNYGKQKVDHSSNVFYTYADEITQVQDVEIIPDCGMCGWNMKRNPYRGDVRKVKTTYTNPYNGIKDCPTGTTDQALCDTNCDPSSPSCSYVCLKEPASISGCGAELVQQMCFCPCGTNFGDSACMGSTTSAECHSSDPAIATGALCSETDYTYEPKIGGTGKILRCVAAD